MAKCLRIKAGTIKPDRYTKERKDRTARTKIDVIKRKTLVF